MADSGTVPIWTPSDRIRDRSRIQDLLRWLTARGVPVTDYPQLWEWSVTEPAGFWDAVREYFRVPFSRPADQVLESDPMPGAVWFPGARLNYVDQVFAGRDPDRIAIVQTGEAETVGEAGAVGGVGTEAVTWTWRELRRQVGCFARTLGELGVGPGDRVVGYLPDVAEAIVAFLGTAAVGAVWSCTGQDYAAPGAITRMAQLEPSVLVSADGYRHGGRSHDRRRASLEVLAGLPTVRAQVVVSRLRPDLAGAASEPIGTTPTGTAPAGTDLVQCIPWARATAGDHPITPVQLPFDHPLWVLFSSGTTGIPKGIVHGHGGVVLEHLKSIALHLDVGPDDVYLWYTSPSWMMWNFRNAGLLVGATVVCHDGSPLHPGPDGLWASAARLGVTVLGTSPGYLLACAKAGVEPGRDHDLRRLRILGATGATLPADSCRWVHDRIGPRVQVASITGGTDVVSAFAGTAPILPVWPGELSAACLGVALDAFDEHGRSVRDAVGELVVTRPMPSMPIGFWNDPDGSRYVDAYFRSYPGVWRHGDWITISSRGTVTMHGRSDSTLNRNGVRMGSADIYQAVERVPEVLEALVIGAELPDGGYWMPLFVTLVDGADLDDDLRGRINAAIREQASPRHVPDQILLAPGIPHTRTGKKLEIPVKRLLQGHPADQVADPRSIDDPTLLTWYAALSPPLS